jgi:hypothetical protein
MLNPRSVRSALLIALCSAIEFFTQKKVEFDVFSVHFVHWFTLLKDNDEPMEG